MKKYMVVDLGGTNIRIGVYQENCVLKEIKRMRSKSSFLNPNDKNKELYEYFISDIKNAKNDYEKRGFELSGICVAFPGPVSLDGNILSAATLWGEEKVCINIKKDLEQLFPNMKIAVINDVSAIAIKYIDEIPNDFCVITVSSGVGNKIVIDKKVIINANGCGGELGHVYYGGKYKSLKCNCGEMGHIGAISSGRGVENLVQLLKEERRDLFEKSILSREKVITTYNIVEAIHICDEFTLWVLRESILPLAQSIVFLFNTIGISCFKIVGGFANAIGTQYVDMLYEVIDNIIPKRIYNCNFDILISLGNTDDNDGMLGAGKYISGINE